MSKIKSIQDHKDSKLEWFNAFAVCFACTHKWIATVVTGTSMFTLECPECGDTDSIGSIAPDGYLSGTEEH